MSKQTRVVFVTSQQAIGQSLCNSIQNFVEMFEDVSFLKGCLSICVTKVEPHLKKQHVATKIKNFKEKFSALSKGAKSFLEMAEEDLTIIHQPTENEVPFEHDLSFSSGFFECNNSNYKVVINKDSIKQAKQMQNQVDKQFTKSLRAMWELLIKFNTQAIDKPSSFDLIIDLNHVKGCMVKMMGSMGEPIS